MNASTTADLAVRHERNPAHEWAKAMLWCALWLAVFFLLPGLAHATGVATGTGAGGAANAQTRITNVATGWQNIVQGVGVAVLVISWSYVGYQLAFAGKTMKDMGPTAIGTSVAGLAPVLVGWMFS